MASGDIKFVFGLGLLALTVVNMANNEKLRKDLVYCNSQIGTLRSKISDIQTKKPEDQ
jgi:hypothetical protein